MDDTVHTTPAILQQRFRDLATQFRQNHAAWQAAVGVHDVTRQAALIAREQQILAAVDAVITAFLATIAQPPGGAGAARGRVPGRCG
jgi:hypothetical protein